jgi:cytoskeleton protein RodZ
MTIESFQDTLFEDPIGLRFRHAREKARWSQESVAQQLKLPVAVLDAIEREDWARLGAPIFVRSYVGSYARLLGLPASLADDVVRGKPAPQLVAIGGSTLVKPNRNAVNLVYVVMTLVIVAAVVALAMYYQSPRRSATVLPLDMPAGHAGPAPQSALAEAMIQPTSYQPASMPPEPISTSPTPAPAAAMGAASPHGDADVARFTVSSEGKIAGN